MYNDFALYDVYVYVFIKIKIMRDPTERDYIEINT